MGSSIPSFSHKLTVCGFATGLDGLVLGALGLYTGAVLTKLSSLIVRSFNNRVTSSFSVDVGVNTYLQLSKQEIVRHKYLKLNIFLSTLK